MLLILAGFISPAPCGELLFSFMGFDSSIPFDESRIQAAAVYCSDGRWGGQMDEFLQGELALPRYDRLLVPGGAAVLAGGALWREAELLDDGA